jgi:hypothetical protein
MRPLQAHAQGHLIDTHALERIRPGAILVSTRIPMVRLCAENVIAVLARRGLSAAVL